MDILFEKFRQKLQYIPIDFRRSAMKEINWDARLIGVKGARGVGKTTLLLQYIKLNLVNELEQTLYISLDSLWFSSNTLSDLVSEFVRKGGKYLFLDEVHKYNGWAQELKNMYDDYPTLKVVFTGSSLLEILNARADLSRRAVIYTMQGFSFREYLNIETGNSFEVLTLQEILKNHLKAATNVNEKLKPFIYFQNYLKQGYYPFYREQPDLYQMRLTEVVNMMLELELPFLRGLDPAYIHKIKQLLVIISESVPFIPNVSKLSDKIGINRTTLLNYLHNLEEVGLNRNLFKNAQGISRLQKPVKIYLENTNLMYLLSPEKVNSGNIRETFFANQVGFKHQLSYSEKGDFLVDNTTVFEIGGKGKTSSQIQGISNAYIAADDIEYGFNNKIPLWLFGFLY